MESDSARPAGKNLDIVQTDSGESKRGWSMPSRRLPNRERLCFFARTRQLIGFNFCRASTRLPATRRTKFSRTAQHSSQEVVMNSFTVTSVGNLAKNPALAVKGDRWARTRLPALFANPRPLRASSYYPLDLNILSRCGRRRLDVAGVRRTTPSKEAGSCGH